MAWASVESDIIAGFEKSPFHLDGWATSLLETYGFDRFEAGGRSEDLSKWIATPLCAVESWLTGRRLVSLPFADHCDPLVESEQEAAALADWICTEQRRGKWKYIELRPLRAELFRATPLVPAQTYWLHTLSLEPSLDLLFSSMHRSGMQRRIRHAEREGLEYERGATDALLDDFSRLLLQTRRRHRLLPQPRAWFTNLRRYLGPAVEIRVARKNGIPVAAIFTLKHSHTVVYKYGCSDERYHSLGAMPFLFWKLIEESKAEGAGLLDFGRTDMDNQGLTAFKDHFGAVRRQITYLRYPASATNAGRAAASIPFARRVFSVLPGALSSRLGGLLYRHMG